MKHKTKFMENPKEYVMKLCQKMVVLNTDALCVLLNTVIRDNNDPIYIVDMGILRPNIARYVSVRI